MVGRFNKTRLSRSSLTSRICKSQDYMPAFKKGMTIAEIGRKIFQIPSNFYRRRESAAARNQVDVHARKRHFLSMTSPGAQ